MSKWPMHEAKARFGELVRKAGTEGPQVVTYRGQDAAVMLSIADYKRLQINRRSFVDHILSGPKLSDEIVDMINERPRDMTKDIEF